MESSLLKSHEAFKARALATPVVEKTIKKKDGGSGKNSPSLSRRSTPTPSPAPNFDYKTSTGSSQYKFSVLAKIVKHMRTRHQQGDRYPLSLEEILDETHQTDLGFKTKVWLENEALGNNPKIEIVPPEDGSDKKYGFKPAIPVKDRKTLLQYLDKQESEGLGGVLMDDIEEALPHAQKAIRRLTEENHIATVARSQDKKQIVFFRPKGREFRVDEEFVKLWRGVAVDGIDDGKVEEYLKKHGITSMEDVAPGKRIIGKDLKRKKGKSKAKIVNNEHLKDVLQDYSDKAALGGKKIEN